MAERFIKQPNLPEGFVRHVIIGESYAEKLGAALFPYGVSVIACPENSRVDRRLSSHADLGVLHLGGNRLVISDAVCRPDFISSLEALGAELVISESPSGCEYPQDCGLCALIFEEKLFHNLKFTDKTLLRENSGRSIHVNQGYTKCAVCPVSRNAAITSDEGVAKRLGENGIDVLTVSSQDIELCGYSHGFFGGAAFKLSKDILAFTGSLDNFCYKNQIIEYLHKHNVTPVFLTSQQIYDVGSIIPLTIA